MEFAGVNIPNINTETVGQWNSQAWRISGLILAAELATGGRYSVGIRICERAEY